MDRTLAIRVIALYAPAILVVLACVLRAPSRRRAMAAFLACAWCLPSLLLVNLVAMKLEWWSFGPSAGAIAGVPGELLLGWVVLWGAVPVLVAPAAPVVVVIALLVCVDLATMPLAAPVIVLGKHWLVGEGVAIVVALLPALVLARWTWRGRRIGTRAAMQAAILAALLLWIVPELIFQLTAGSWARLRETWHAYGGIPLQLAMIPVVMGLSAVQEFATRGRGTPLPFDPPRRLVTSGPYAYIANPMQLSVVLMLTMWGIIVGSGWMMLAGPIGFAYSIGLAAWDEKSDLIERFGDPWRAYRRHVRAWIPRWRPFDASSQPRLYVAAGCGQCSEVAAWFAARHPLGLEIVPAELHPTRDLERVTYDPGDGTGDEEGVAALARALEHINLAWALLGWLVRLPGLRFALQLIVDASGGEARTIPRSCQPARAALHTRVAVVLPSQEPRGDDRH